MASRNTDGTAAHEDSGHLSSLDERAYLALRKMIVDGTLRPGEQLVQETLAERLGVSRTPLRKAVATLAQEGFVELTSRGAAFVRSFSEEELISVWEIRAVLEGLVCRTAARTAKPQHVAYLRSLITSAIEHVTPEDWTTYQDADREFHRYIAGVANDSLLTRILDAYQILSISLAQGLLRPPAETLPEHVAILDAIEAGDADRAEQAMVQHIRASMRYLRRRSREGTGAALLEQFGPVFKSAISQLTARIGETAFVAHREGQQAVVIAAEEPDRLLKVTCDVGLRLPLHATAVGKALIAGTESAELARLIGKGKLQRFGPRSITRPAELRSALREIKLNGYASEEAEFEDGVCALAVPITNGGKVIAALSVAVPVGRYISVREGLLTEIQATVEEIQAAI